MNRSNGDASMKLGTAINFESPLSAIGNSWPLSVSRCVLGFVILHCKMLPTFAGIRSLFG